MDSCKSLESLEELTLQISNSGDTIENVAKDAIDKDELSEDFVKSFLPRLFDLCNGIAILIMLKNAELHGDNGLWGTVM